MKLLWLGSVAIGALLAGAVAVLLADQLSRPPLGRLQSPPAVITLKDGYEVPVADAQTRAIVEAAQAFLGRLNDSQRAAAMFALSDDTQRANWSNFPEGAVARAGVMRGDLTAPQTEALEALLATILSPSGTENIRRQLAAEDMLQSNSNGGFSFGSDYYYAAFLGTPSAEAPWMFQFGGHHLAINVTVFGAQVSFSPMLTGGQPLNITMGGQDITIAAEETAAAERLMNSLSEAQKQVAIRGKTAINLLLGPGAFGATLAPEGIKASALSDDQKALLLALIETRLGFINADDFAAKMQVVKDEIDETYFGWWGAQSPRGAAYFRITGPSVILEYAPQDMGGDPTDHAHNMYRDPSNDYGAAWLAAE